MNHVRIHGDPFGDSPEASALRSFLRFALGNGMHASLSLSAAPARAAGPGERLIPLTDGVRNWNAATQLPPAEVELILRAAEAHSAATAPLVVFADPLVREDVVRLAGLEWPKASAVIAARCGMTAPELMDRVRGELRWAGSERQRHSCSEGALRPWIGLEQAEPTCIVHVADDPFACGSDLVVTTFAASFADRGLRLRLVLPGVPQGAIAELRALAGDAVDRIDVVQAPFEPRHVLDAAMIVQPYRRFASSRELVFALASARPLAVARFADNADLLAGRAVVHPVGGRHVREDAEHGAYFAPHPLSLVAAWTQALGESHPSATGARARAHVVAELTRGRPALPPPPVHPIESTRPTVVLEAPMFETSSSAELTIATARALQVRGNVELRLVPSTPFQHDLGWLRSRAPELEPCLTRNPGRVDLWLSSGWPVRADRPDCREWALRVDWEYGALPQDLTPHVTEDADRVVVHSEYVYRTVMAAGRPMDSITVVPHGVDEAMHAEAPPDPRVLAFKGNLPAVLFCGGLVWRKGFDVFLSAVLAARAKGHEFVVVVKGIGSEQHYGGYHLGGLLERFENTAGTPPLLRLEGNLSREELASVYTACDAMLHPYRGEGFCMPVLEARACGLPVIATSGGATEPLMAGAGAFRIRSERRSLDLPGAHVAQPWILEPDPDSAAEELDRVLGTIADERQIAKGLAPAVREAFTWNAAAAMLEELADAGFRKRSVRPSRAEPTVVLPPPPARTVAPGAVDSQPGAPSGPLPVRG